MLDILPEHNSYAVDIAQAELAYAIRLVYRLRGNLRSSTDDLFVIGVKASSYTRVIDLISFDDII